MPGKVKGLAHWCKKVTEGYRGGEVTDMSSCWKNGLAFCALIHRFRPHLIDYGSLSPENIYENNELAYSIAEKEFGIMSLLDPKDMVEMACPDRKSVAIYVSQIYDYFKDEQIVEREVEYKTEIKDIINTKDSKNDFAENASKLTDETNMEFVLDSNGNTDNASVNISVAVPQDILKDCENSDRKITVQTSDGITEVVSANRKDSISDIDDIFEANAALLQEDVKDDLKEETELERKGKDVVCDLCEEIEIPDSFNGTFKADAVLKAAVCAGITAVAITAGGDTENEIEAMKTISNAKKSQNETDIEKNENMSIPEIQITFIEERLSADEKERTPYLVKSTEESDASASLEYASPEVETKIKSMHEQSLATSSSDSFQSAEYVIVHDNDQQTQGKINVRNEIEKEEADADQLVLVLADVDSSAEINDTCLNSMKATGSVSSESFTSTSSLVSTDSSSSNPGSKNIASQEKINKNPSDILNTKAIVPDKDSEIEIFVDEDDEEPPALPAVGPPPLPEQIEGIPFTQEEVIIQGELEVLCSEPVNTIIIENTDMGKTPVQKDISDEKLTSNESNYLQASSVDAVPDSTAENVSAVVQRETIAERLSEEQISCVISQDIGSALNENLSQDLSLDIATKIADTEKTVNPERVEIDYSQGQPLDEMPGESNFEISHPSSENMSSAQIENIVTHCESFVDKNYKENTDNMKFSLPDKAGLKESTDKEGKNDAEITSTGSTEGEKSEETYDIIHDEKMQSPISRAEQDPLQCNEKFSATLVDSNQSSPVLRKESVTSSENDTLNIKHSVKADQTDPLLKDEQDLMIEKDAVKENTMNQTVSNESREYGDSSYIDKIIDKDASKIITAPTIASGVKVEEFEKPSLLNKDNKVDEHAKYGSEGKDAELKDSSVIIPSGKSAKIEDAIDRDNILQKDTGGKPRKTYMRTPLKWDANADVDINLLKKAKEMSKRMAEKQINILQSPRPSEEVSEKSEEVNAKDSLLEDSDKQVRSEKSMNKDKEKDEARSRRLEILRQLQKSTRPTKKRIGDAELETSDSFSDSSADFKSKMKLWNRKSSTTQEPDEIISSSGSSTPDSTSRKSFPAFSTSPVQTPSSPRDDQSNLQKLTQSLPSSPRPGSVAEYVRRISLSSQCRPDSETDISSVPNESLFNGTEVLRRERPPIENRDKVLFRRSTGTVSPAFVLSRPARNSQPIKVSVKPLVQRYTEKEQNNEKRSPAPVPSPKPSRYSGDFSLIVKPLNDKYALSDEESKTKKQEEKKEELERKDSLNRRNPPKRNMSITRPRSRSSSRERNIWQHDYNSDVITSPTIDKRPSVTRKDSFEVKVRPVSLQLSKDEMDNENNDQNNIRRHSLSNANSGSKVNISVQPLSSRPRTVSASVATEPTVSKKPVPNKIATPQNQTTSTLAPTVSMGTQERQSRPRSSLSPRWTSKVDSSRPVPKSEPLSITTKHPGNSVLSYVQSCLNQKTAPKSLQEKAAANRRPATFTSADISRPSIVYKKSVTGAIQSDNQPALKQPVKDDSVSICSSIFASKLKYDRDRAGYSNENMPGKSTGDNIDSHKILSPENTETSSSASSSFVDLSEQEKLLVSPTSHIDGSSDIGGEKIKDIEVEIIDLVKETIYQEPEQKLCQKEEALKDTNIDISFPDEISLTDSPRTPKSENKSTSDNSVSSSFSDSESEKDNAIKKSVSHIKLSYKKENTGAVEPSFKEMPEAVTEKAKSPKIHNRTDERSLDKPLSVSSTSSIDSIDHKSDVESLDTEARLFENKEVTCIKEMFEEMPDLVNKLNTPDYVASVHVKPFDEAIVTPLLQSSVGNAPDDDKHEDSHTESDHSPKANVITKQGKDSGIVDDKADTKIDLQTDTSDDSESDSSQSEDKNKCQNLSLQSTSSTSSAEIEKPELKEGLKNIILELEKELVNNLKDDDTAQVESSDTVDSAVCLPVTTSIAEIKPDNRLNMSEDLKDNVYQPKVDIEEVSEKDLFEDFDNLVSSLKNNEDIAVFAKELEVVAEDEIEGGDMRQEPYTSYTDDRRKQSFGEKKPKTSEDSNFNQKDETIEAIQNTPVLASIDENDVAKEVVILSNISPEFSEPEINTKNPEEETITQGSAIVPHLNVAKEETLKSSSSSSSSRASRTSLKEEADDDELLRNVIEDSQPFKAPLLEQIIDSSKSDKNFADSTNSKFEAFQPLSDDLLNVSDSTEITINENQKDGEIGEVVSGEDENALSNNLKLVSIIESEDPIILSAVADANDISSPLEVNVSVFESSFQDTDRISPVLFPEEEVLKQHGFTDVIGETLEDDPILLSAIANVKAEERKEIFRKDSDKSSNDSSDSEHAVETEAKKEEFESNLQKANGTDDASNLENFLTEDVKSDKKSETMSNSSSSAKRPTDSESSISGDEVENADGQSAQSENESEDGMKYKFRGKDGNCYLLLDNDPTSPVAKTLISMEKEKSENLKNSSLSSMSDEQIQDAIDSINLKHSQYIPVSGITVSLKNPEYFLDQKFDPFEVEFIEPQKDFVIETEQLDSEQILLENDKSSNLHDAVVTDADNENLKPDLCEFTTEQASENEASEEDATCNKEIKPVIQGDEPVIESDLEQGENEEISDSLWKGNQRADEAVVQYDPTSKAKDIAHNQTELKSVGHIELSGSETSSSSSSKYTESKPHKKKKKRKTKKNKRHDSENLKDKFKNTIQRCERNRYTSSSESDFDGKTSSDLKKTVPIENIELVGDHKQSISNEENDEKKICCELEQDCSEQKINEVQFVNENDIDLEFVKDLKSSPEKEKKLNDSDTSHSESDFDGETSSDLKKTVPIENIELVGDHKLSFSNEENDEKKICHELKQDSSEQKINELQFVNENDIELEFVKETVNDDLKSSPEKEEKINDSGTGSSESDSDGEISSDLKKTVSIENIELVGDHKQSFSNKENDERKICHKLEQDCRVQKVNEVQFVNENDIHLEVVKETVSDLSPIKDIKSSSEKEEKINDSDTSELNNNASDRNKTLRQSKSSETNSSSSDSVSSAESSESDTEIETNVVNIDKDTITVDKTKSKVYHSDDNLKSDISDESDSGSTDINKHSEIKEPLESEFSIKCQGVSANYENWPIIVKQLDIKCKEVGLDTDKKEDFDNNNE